jgi:hypothetical protein
MTAKKKQDKSKITIDASKPIPKQLNQERFCFLYSSGKNMETFGNATKSYIQAFGFLEKINKANEELTIIPYNKEIERKKKRQEVLKMENNCRANSSYLLTNPNIVARCDWYLMQLYSDDNVDAELSFAIRQRKDIPSKVSAIKEYNRVKNRVQEKISGEITIVWGGEEPVNKK